MIERAWSQIRSQPGNPGAIRVDETHPADFYTAQDAQGRLGLLLILGAAPHPVPALEALNVVVGERADGRWGLSIWLESGVLIAPFTQLCDDLMESSRGVPADRIGGFVVARLQRWQELLEAADSGMSLSKLRGLIGELLLIRDALSVYAPGEVIGGWAGPYRAPQDFALPGLWIEVKATFPTARTVRISSADQLAAPGRTVLAVFSLASLLPHDPGVTAQSLVGEVELRLRGSEADDLVADFQKRLAAVGYQVGADYARMPFRLDATRYFEVIPGFPRLTPADLPLGIAEVSYDLDLGALSPFEVGSPVRGHDGPG